MDRSTIKAVGGTVILISEKKEAGLSGTGARVDPSIPPDVLSEPLNYFGFAHRIHSTQKAHVKTVTRWRMVLPSLASCICMFSDMTPE